MHLRPGNFRQHWVFFTRQSSLEKVWEDLPVRLDNKVKTTIFVELSTRRFFFKAVSS